MLVDVTVVDFYIIAVYAISGPSPLLLILLPLLLTLLPLLLMLLPLLLILLPLLLLILFPPLLILLSLLLILLLLLLIFLLFSLSVLILIVCYYSWYVVINIDAVAGVVHAVDVLLLLLMML